MFCFLLQFKLRFQKQYFSTFLYVKYLCRYFLTLNRKQYIDPFLIHFRAIIEHFFNLRYYYGKINERLKLPSPFFLTKFQL